MKPRPPAMPRCEPACIPSADRPAAPAFRHVSSSERGGWSLLGRLLIWAMRNSGDGAA